MGAACLEYFVELRFWPWLKVPAVSRAGLAAVVAGELLRKTAMVGASASKAMSASLHQAPTQLLSLDTAGCLSSFTAPPQRRSPRATTSHTCYNTASGQGTAW